MAQVIWTKKFAPLNLDECSGNDDARGALKTWALDWERGKSQKPVMISGPSGCGKTAAVRGLANQMQWPLVEIDVSGSVDSDKVKQQLSESTTTGGLFSNHRLYFVDELDGAVARGTMPALASFAKDNLQPIIFAVNDAWETKLAPVRSVCKMVEFKGVNPSTVQKVLASISAKQHAAEPTWQVPEATVLSELSKGCGGDLRAAILDLQAGGIVSFRDTEVDVFRTVAKILKAQTVQDAMQAADSADVDLQMLIKWLEENVSEEYESDEEMACAFQWLSRADVFSGRITRRQQWGLLAYVRYLAIGGTASSKRKPYVKFTRYRFPSYIKALSTSRARRAVLVSAGKKVSQTLHCAKSEGLESLLYLSGSPKVLEAIGLSEEEIGEASMFVATKKKA